MGDRDRYERPEAWSRFALLRARDSHRPGAVIAGCVPRTQTAQRNPLTFPGTPVISYARRFPVGAEVTGAGVHFRVWAPVIKKIEVVLDGGGTVTLEREASGYFSGLAPNARVGSRYKFKLDGGETCPDPASRFQPEGPHGWSEVIDATAFAWTDKN